MAQNLDFLRTLTVEQFKDELKVNKLQIKQAAGSSKYFFQYGGATGAVATQNHSLEEVLKNPMVSYVKGEPTDQNPDGKFWMLHMEGNGGATVLVTL